MILRLSDKRSEGSYSHIFVVPGSNRAYKLFLNKQAPNPNPTAIRNEERRQLVFEDEVKAYGLACSAPELKGHVPEFFGPQAVSNVLDNACNSIASRYVLDRCYSMEWVDGPVDKLNQQKYRHPYLEALEKRFQNAGIWYTRDASVINAQDEQRAVLIDFGTSAFEPEHEELPFNF